MTLRPYTPDLATAWDNLVRMSRNGTFLFERAYMDYHADRFRDASLLFYNDKGALVGLLPASWRNDAVVSHGGLTYGGFVTSDTVHAIDVGEMMTLAIDHYRSLGVRQIILKPVPTIYHRLPADDELYWLFRHGAHLTARGLSSTIDLSAPLPFSTLRRRKVSKARRAGYVVDERVTAVHQAAQQDDALAAFWTILTDVLRDRHGLSPVHSLDEMRLLSSRFPNNIRLVVVRNAEGSIVAGTLLYITQQVVHAQYIASSVEGRENGALELLFDHIITQLTTPLRDTFARYFDFGISTEDGGHYLNEGLIFQKEGFGARSTVYDVWTLEL